MFTEKIIVDSEYVENVSLSELQPPQLKTIYYILFGNFLHVLLMWTLFFLFVFLFSLALFSFLSCFFFLMLFVSVHKILILCSLYPNNFLFFFFSKFFLWLLFHLSDFPPFITTIFFIYLFFFELN